MKRFLLLSFMLLLAFTFSESWAQERTVSGKVTSAEDGSTLPGVNVVLKGTTTGTVTDIDGNYTLSVPGGDGTLVFSFIGLTTQEVQIGNRSVVEVQMTQDVQQLSEVVITGYGDKTRDQLASAVSVIDNSEIATFNTSNSIDNILQGKAAGVSIVGANGRPGQTALVNIRGITSIQGGTNPLYIVDGVPIDPSNVNNINPADIESISILKDAATAALYGSRAGNGVIVITTKKGQKGSAQVSFRSSYGKSKRISDNFDIMNAEQSLRYEAELAALGVNAAGGLPGGRTAPANWGPFLNRETNWEDELLKRGTIESQNLSIRGGSDNATFFFSLARDRNDGIIRNLDGFERYASRLNASIQANKWLEVGANVSVSKSTSDLPRDRNNVQNPIRALYDYKPYATVFVTDDDGNLILDSNGEPQYNFGEGIGLGFNIAEAIVNNPEEVSNLVSIGSAYADVKFSKNFSNRVTLGISNNRLQGEYFLKPGSRLDQFVGDASNPGSKRDNGSNDYRLVLTNMFTYSQTFNDVHNISARALYEYNERRFTNYSLRSSGFVTDRLSVQSVSSQPTAASTSATENILVSYGGFVDYDYDGRYIASASLRRDGSSRFGADNRWGTFWAASAAWNLHKEGFFNIEVVNSLKVRASYGESGNNQIGDFSSLSTVNFDSRNGQSTVIPNGAADPSLQWESQQILDFGVETTLLSNRLTFVADYFKRTSSDLLGSRPLSVVAGDENNEIQTNIGEIETSGFEFEVSANVVSTNELLVTVGGNIFFLDTEVNELSEGADIFNSFTVLREGEEINTFFLNRYAGVNPANGEALWLTKDGEITNVFNGEDAVALDGKSPQADYQGGVFVSASWKGIDFRADAVFRGGNYIYNNIAEDQLSDGVRVNANQRVDAFNYWKKPGDTNVLPSPLFGSSSAQTSDRFLQKGDYIRLRNVSLGYSLPTQLLEKIGLSYVRVFVQGQNLLTYRPHFDGDPEVGIGSGETLSPGDDGFITGEFNLYSYPQTRSYTAGIEIRL